MDGRQGGGREPRTPMRADARRSVDALVEGARAVFARDGVDAHVKAIALQAGVGVATLYRHFPRRSDLILAVLESDVDACVEAAHELAAAHPPMDALDLWLDRYCAFVLTKHGLAAALHSDAETFAGLGEQLLERLEPALDALLQATRAAGMTTDAASAMDLLRAVAHLCTPGPAHAAYTRRMIGLLLAGLRYGPLPRPRRTSP
ncbi:TetR/AcrR family transcriptional regulator [Streptomyces spinosirectus]|uniref:TetR/AcrR family transcriptional regulator n=1 Tax=Streptomyces TaxID=1883 RepID=UPI000D4B04E9|nr:MULTISPECIES: TetR/AcrR family transcriptional regulator [Streptomyces]PTM95835.1 TetR family transcriptional regulator [Streptomyces sp. VMFN-G11Ma]UIR19100.1 TetR/AcrR family transcriptional regulator [Streptomyces spinosirectus]